MNTLLTKDYHLTKNKSLSCWLMEGTIFKKHTLKKKTVIDYEDLKHKK